jgi:hypothetical protein
MSNRPTALGIGALIAAGAPADLFSDPNFFYQTSRAGKLHADEHCSKLKRDRYSTVATNRFMVAMASTPDTAYCSVCVIAPTHERTARNREHALTVLSARQAHRRLLAELSGAAPADLRTPATWGAAPPPPLDTAGLPPIDIAPVIPDPVNWQQVTAATAIRNALDSVLRAAQLDERVREWATPDSVRIGALLSALTQAAGGTDTATLHRLAVLDLLSPAPRSYSSYAAHQAPDEQLPPTADPEKYPAVCRNDYRGGADGFKQLAQHAWVAWRAVVRSDGDLTAAAEAAQAAVVLDEVVPEHVPQLPTATAVVPYTPGQTPWEWLVANWRATAAAELTAMVAEWAQAYTAALQAAECREEVIVELTDWTFRNRSANNPSTQMLARLAVVTDEVHDVGLVRVPGVVADWLCEYGITGRRHQVLRDPPSVPRTRGEGIIAARVADPTDTPEVLAMALRLWVHRGRNNYLYGPAPLLEKLDTALDTARGMLTGA